MPITETSRLFIQEATLEDAGFFLKLMNSPNWLKFIGDRGIRSEMEAARYIQKSLIDSYQNHGYGLYKMVLKKDGRPIGICGFVRRDYLDHADIGFALLPSHEGKGYALEAANACLDYGSSVLGLHPILAVTTIGNGRSRALLGKIGLHEVGSLSPKENGPELLLFSNA